MYKNSVWRRAWGVWGLCGGLLLGCGDSKTPATTDEKPLAKVGEAYLYASQLRGLGASGASPEDSAARVQVLVQNWVQQQLLRQAAQDKVRETPEMQQQVEQYRAALLVSAYENELVKNQLDTFVSPQELAEFYAEHKAQFPAGEELVRCHFVRLRANLENAESVREWFKAGEMKRVQEYCVQHPNETVCALNRDMWVSLAQLANKAPRALLSSKYLQNGEQLDEADGNFIYLLKVFEYRTEADPAPLQYIQNDLRALILAQRREKLLQTLRADLLQTAERNKAFEIY